MIKILQYLKTNGEKLDSDIAANAGISLATAHSQLTELEAKGQVMSCHKIRFVDGQKIEGMSYRLAGHIIKTKPGVKPK